MKHTYDVIMNSNVHPPWERPGAAVVMITYHLSKVHRISKVATMVRVRREKIGPGDLVLRVT